MVTAFDAATIGKHLRIHQEEGGSEVGLFYCRCCDRIKEKYKVSIKAKDFYAGEELRDLIILSIFISEYG